MNDSVGDDLLQIEFVEDYKEDSKNKRSTIKYKYSSEICGKDIQSAQHIVYQTSSFPLNKLFNCNECGKSFRSEQNLRSHQFYANHTSNYLLKYENNTFSEDDNSRGSFIQYLKLQECCYSCFECGMKFKTKILLNKHLHLHSDAIHSDVNGTSAPVDVSNLREKFYSKNIKPEVKQEVQSNDQEVPTENGYQDTNVKIKEELQLNKIKFFHCEVCGNYFTSKEKLIVHSKLHKNIKREPCKEEVGKTIRKKRGRKRIYTEENKQCNDCGKVFNTIGNLRVHRRIHTNEKPYMCSVCGRPFRTKGNLNTHLFMHSNVRPFSCDLCEKSFTTKGNLIVHMRTHFDEKPFTCDQCYKSFTTKGNLMIHKYTHEEIKPFECSICKRQFATNSNLNAHMRVHTSEKPYNCNVCKKSFCSQGALKSHQKSRHFNSED